MSNRNRKPRLPVHLTAALEEIRQQIKAATEHGRKGRPFYLSIGEVWEPIKIDPMVDELGSLEAIKPYLPASVQWLNRCLVAWDGHRTGDLERGELYAQQIKYHPQNREEPYLMAELTELWRRKKPQSRRPTIPLAMIEGNLFVRSRVVKFQDGTCVLGDCHDLIESLPDAFNDALINDPTFGLWNGLSHGSFGKIGHEWDKGLNWDRLWPNIWRTLKPAGNAVICAAQPLASMLIASQLEKFLYCLYWFRKATNMYGPKQGRPMNVVEPIPVFSQGGATERRYNPQMRDLGEIIDQLRRPWRRRLFEPLLTELEEHSRHASYRSLNPTDLIMGERTPYDSPHIQYCQKPVELMRYLIRTFSNPGDLILDITAGSQTTAVAAVLERRRFITFEQNHRHFALGTQRLERLYRTHKFPDW